MKLAWILPLFTLFSVFAHAQNWQVDYNFDAVWEEDTWNGDYYSVPGYPVIPKVVTKVIIPYGQDISKVEFTATGKTTTIPHTFETLPMPTAMCEGVTPLLLKAKPGEVFPEKRLLSPDVEEKHGYKVAYVTVFPVQVNEKTKTAEKIEGGTLTVEFKVGKKNTLYRGLDQDRDEVQAIIGNTVGASGGQYLSTYPSVLRKGTTNTDYVAIAPQKFIDDSHMHSLTRLISSKNDAGVSARMVSTESIASKFPGADLQEKIRNAITKYYKEEGLQYALLVGNGSTVTPTRILKVNMSEGSIPSDFYFACLDGDFKKKPFDTACEVAVGRAPVTTVDDMHAFVKKTLAMQYMDDEDPRIKKVLNFGEVLDRRTLGSRMLDHLMVGGTAGKLVTKGYPENFEFTKFYETQGREYNSAAAVQKLASGDYYTVNHLGHASESYCMRFMSTEISKVTNPLPFFGITQGCHPGNISKANWASKMVVNPNGGPAAMIANSNYGYYTSGADDGPSNRFHLAFYDAAFRDGLRNLGKIHFHAKEKLADQVNSTEIMRWVVYETNLLGDPELSLKFPTN